MTKLLVTAHEWEPVTLPTRYDNPRIRGTLHRSGRFRSGEMFSLRRDCLHARDMAGFLDIGPLQVQVLPKIYSGEADSREVAVLLRMMSALVPDLHAELALASAAAELTAPLEPILAAIARRLFRLFSGGLPRRYAAQHENVQTIRGRIDFAEMSRRRAGSAQWIPVRYGAMAIDNDLSRVCKALLESLDAATRRRSTSMLLRQCLATLGGVRSLPLTPQLAGSVHVSRFEAEWTWPLALARLLAGGRAPDAFTPGDFPSWSLVFPLDRLFEALVAQCAARALAGSGIAVRQSWKLGSLLRWTGGIEKLPLKPDVVFVDGQGVTKVVGDAKWKRLEWRGDEPRLSPKDVYQMTAYLTRANCARGILFFPAHESARRAVHVRVAEVLPGRQKLAVIELDVTRFATQDAAASDAELREVILQFAGDFGAAAS